MSTGTNGDRAAPRAREPLRNNLFRDTAQTPGRDPVDGIEETLVEVRDQIARVEQLTRRLERVQAAQREPATPTTATATPAAAPAPGHLLFIPGADGYRTRAADGASPRVGEEITDDDRRYLVLKIGRSPFPGDPRRCAFLERLGPPAQLEIGLVR